MWLLIVTLLAAAQDMLARARETGHSTAREAAEIAREAGAARLLLTHFSSRYAEVEPLLAEARAVFPNTEAAVELAGYVVEAQDAPEPEPAGRNP